MLATPHILAGGAIGRLSPRTWLVVPLAFASHLLLDIVPHLDSHSLFGRPGGSVTPLEAVGALADTLLGTALLLFLLRRAPGRGRLFWAAFAGIALDLVDNVPPWGHWFRAWSGTAWLSAFHHGIQHNTSPDQWLLGFGTQALVIALAVWLLRPTS